MIIRIGILEDEEFYIEQLKTIIHEYFNNSPMQFSLSAFTHTSQTILNSLFNYDILILDIEIGNENGMKIAHYLRDNGFQGHLVFVTNYKEYVFEGYHVNATDYLLKPINRIDFFTVLDRILLKPKYGCYIIKSACQIVQIPFRDILYFSTDRHYIDIHVENNVYRQLENLKNILPVLPDFFVQCHRTCIVNLYHIQKIINNELVLPDNIVLPISKTYLDLLHSKYMNIMF